MVLTPCGDPEGGGDKGSIVVCWFSSFVIFRGSGSILLRNPIFCDFSVGAMQPGKGKSSLLSYKDKQKH